MNKVLEPLIGKGVVVYLDDIMVYSQTKEEHYELLWQVLALLKKHQLFAKLSKCEFLLDQVDFLGHIISKNGISTDPSKCKAINNWLIPRNINKVQWFLSLANYYCRFIKHYSHIVAPITDLLMKNTSFLWGEKCNRVFDELKSKLTHTPVLLLPDLSQSF